VNLIKQKLTIKERKIFQEGLRLIDVLTKVGRDNGFRIIVSGGYAVDGFFGEVTRCHNDIDIQIYGIEDNARGAADRLLNKMGGANGLKYTVEDKGRKEYYHNLVYKFGNLNLDIYYLQTKTNPLAKEKFIIKSNGSVDEQEFGKPIYGKFGDISFEIQDPLVEMKDKIYKREKRGDPKRSEHDQDINNLKLALNR